MDGFTIIDGVVAGVIVISAILAYSRGFVREVMAIVGWIIAAVVAFIFAPTAFPLVDEIPYLGTFIGGSNELGIIVAFAGVFAIALVIVSIFTPLFASAVQRSVLGGLDAGLGFLFGVARGILLTVVALIVYDRVSGDQAVPMVDDSRTAQIFGQLQDRIEAQIPSNAPAWILDRYEELINSTESATDEPAAPETTGN
ncbi:CvpA family protein [Rhodophyticola porphyridii]|uniref:CvpA family protein n=1 Tax=Rhodophyticola porphyridii TaxID=1852017 RepID=A0A3L9Y435_9RHOB|nr:CvpA family protein [Rhodophyticola porphyridii]RMA42088.1 CvpA family protein [Rhodophyticola porphyridii]